MRKRKVAVLGATGTVGQRFIGLLQGHPWFELSALTTSDAKAGKRYGITIRRFDIHREGKLLFQKIEYDAGVRGRWMVDLQGARILTDDEMLADLAATGLRLLRWIDQRHRWLAAALL